MATTTRSDAEHAAFMAGFHLARSSDPDDADALDRAAEAAFPEAGHLRVAIPKDLAKAILAEVEALPEHLACAAWAGFIRGLIAQAGGAPVHVHGGGTA